MADFGNYSALIGDLNPQIAAGPPKVDFSGIERLPDSFQAGFKQKQERDQATAFKNGVPTLKDGSADYGSILKTLFQTGNYAAAEKVAPLAIQQANIAAGQSDVSFARTNGTPGQAQPDTPQQPQAPRPSVMPPSMTGSSSRVVGDQEGVDKGYYDRPTTPGGRPPIQNDERPIGPQAQNAPMVPTPVPTQRIVPDNPPQMGASNPTEPLVPNGRMQAVINEAFARAAAASNRGQEGLAKALLEKAKGLQEQLAPTPEIKNYNLGRQPNETLPEYQKRTEQEKAQASEQGKGFAKKYTEVVELGNKAFQEIPQIEAIQKLMNDPNFYSGVGEKYNLAFKRILTAVGGDPNSSLPQEAFRKVVSGSILNSLAMLKGLGQIRVAEINLAKEASASPDNSPASNRMLVEISKRTYQRAAAVAELAQGYNGGNLDAGFDKVVSKYYKEHPLFNDAELKNPKLLSLPRFGSPQEVAASKLPSGSQFIDSTGQPRVVP